jgi:serine/threonine protein kinase
MKTFRSAATDADRTLKRPELLFRACQHRNVCNVRHVFRDRGSAQLDASRNLYVVSQFCKGGTLAGKNHPFLTLSVCPQLPRRAADIIYGGSGGGGGGGSSADGSNGPVPARSARVRSSGLVRVLLQVDNALEHLHQPRLRCYHRNIKASNILLDEDNNIFVSDYGVSAKCDSTIAGGAGGGGGGGTTSRAGGASGGGSLPSIHSLPASYVRYVVSLFVSVCPQLTLLLQVHGSRV